MDGDGSLEAIALVVSLILFGLLAAVDGHVSAGGQVGAAEQGRARPRVHFRKRRRARRAQLIVAAAAAFAVTSLAHSQDIGWSAFALWVAGLLAALALLQGIGSALGARWAAAARLAIPLLWPLALLATPLDLAAQRDSDWLLWQGTPAETASVRTRRTRWRTGSPTTLQ